MPLALMSQLCFIIDIDPTTAIIFVGAIFLLSILSTTTIFHILSNKMKRLRNLVKYDYNENLLLDRDASKKLIEAIPSSVAVYANDGYCIYMNDQCRSLFNISDDAQISNLFESRILSAENCEKIKNGQDISGEVFLNYSYNTPVIFGQPFNEKTVIKYNIRAIYNTRGKISNYILAIDNVSNEYKQRQKAEEYQFLLRDCLQLSGISAYVYDVDKDRYFQLRDGNIISTEMNFDYIIQRIEAKYRGQYIEMFLRMKNGEILTDTRRYPLYSTATKKYYYVETSSFGFTGIDNKVVRILQTIRNVTENQEKLLDFEAVKLIQSTILRTANIITWRYDFHDKIFRSAVIGSERTRTFEDGISRILPEDRSKYASMFDNLVNNNTAAATHITVRKTRPAGVFKIYAIPMHNDQGTLTEIVGITSDVSEQYSAESTFDGAMTKMNALVVASNCWLFEYNYITDSLSVISWKDGIHRTVAAETYIKMVATEQQPSIQKIYEQLQRQEIDEFHTNLSVCADKNTDYKNMEFCGKAYEYANELPTKLIAYAKYI